MNPVTMRTLERVRLAAHLYLVQEWREILDAKNGRRGVRKASVGLGKIHAISELQTRDLGCPVLDFQIGLQNSNMDRFALSGVLAVHADAVKFEITVMGFHEFIEGDGGVHD